MVKKIDDIIANVLRIFRTRKVLTVVQIATRLQCSVPTARRRLKEWSVYSSYNKNGRYYTLPDIPRFDEHGLWSYRGIAFSKYGTLKGTVVQLVADSQAGLSAAELGQLLDLQPRSFLSHFRDHPQLRREKYQDRFIYFSVDEETYNHQRQCRMTMTRAAKLPSDSEAVAILVETIKHPRMTLADRCRQLKKQGVSTTPEIVRNFFAYHGLTLKKTPHSPL